MAVHPPYLRTSPTPEPIVQAAATIRSSPRTEWIDRTRRDQSDRWSNCVGVPVELYFELLPDLRAVWEDALVMICGEARCRRQVGEFVALAEYESRFPELAADLAIQFELDGILGNLSDEICLADSNDLGEIELPGLAILREIGRGATGVVYLARQLSVDRLVAVKVIRAWSADENHRVRHRQEAAILSRMKHPGVVQIYDVLERDGLLCSVIEYVDGPTLAEATEGQPQPPHEAAHLVRTLARTVHAVHEAGILHRDLKPSNVLLTSGGDPKITDFGLAKLITNSSLRSTHHGVLGTPSYMPPEQAVDDGHGAAEGDVYSLGAILYELLTGHPPFLGVTVLDTLAMIRDREPMLPQFFQPRIPRDVATICLKCLAKSPEARYRSAETLADDLDRFLAGEPIRARRPARHEILVRWCRRHPTIAGLTACLLATAVIGFFGVVWQWRQAEHARQSESVARYEADNRTREVREGLRRFKLANGFLERGRDHLAARDWDDADAAFTRAVELRPDHVQAWEDRGELVYFRLGLWDLAAADFSRAYELQRPNTAARWWWNALFRAHLRDVDGYRRVCTEMQQRFKRNRAAPLGFDQIRALCLDPQADVDIERMVELADAMAAANPGKSIFMYLQALVAHRAERYDHAVARCQESLDAEGNSFPRELNYPILAIAYNKLGRNAEAKAAIAHADEALRQWTNQRCKIGSEPWVTSLGAHDDWPISPWDWLEYEIYLRQAYGALGVPPMDDPRWVLLRARALAGLRRPDAAQQAYDAALKCLPNDAQVQLEAHRHSAYYRAGRTEFRLSAEEFAKAGQLKPDDYRLVGFCALTKLAAGDVDGYRATCADMMRRFGDTKDKSIAHELVEVCTLRPDALPEMSRLLSLAEVASTSYLGSLRVLGAAQYRAGQWSEAVQCFEKASKLNSPGPWGLAFLAMAHHALGQTDMARECLAKATRWVESANDPDPDDLTSDSPKWGGWYEKVNVPIVLAEARALIDPTPASTATRP